jgi:hypothetical protein
VVDILHPLISSKLLMAVAISHLSFQSALLATQPQA